MNIFLKIINLIISFVRFQKEKYQLIKFTKVQHNKKFENVKQEAYRDAKTQMSYVLKQYTSESIGTPHYQANCRAVMNIYQDKLDAFNHSCKMELQKIRKMKFLER